MFQSPNDDMEKLVAPASQAFKFWISFWPVAPFFGVEWRFADMARAAGMPTAMPGDGRLPAAKPRRAARKALDAQVRTAEQIAEAPAVSRPAAEDKMPAPEKFEEAIEAAMEPEPAEESFELEAEAPATEKPKGLMSKAPKQPDDLKMIKGIGPGLEKQLNGIGVYTFKQIAEMSEKNLAWVDENLTAFKGRCFRDDWIGQSKSLMN